MKLNSIAYKLYAATALTMCPSSVNSKLLFNWGKDGAAIKNFDIIVEHTLDVYEL